MNASLSETLTLDQVRAEFPDWRVFEVRDVVFRNGGGWQPKCGPQLLLAAISADDPQALARRIATQEWLESLSPADLTLLWERATGGKW